MLHDYSKDRVKNAVAHFASKYVAETKTEMIQNAIPLLDNEVFAHLVCTWHENETYAHSKSVLFCLDLLDGDDEAMDLSDLYKDKALAYNTLLYDMLK